MNNDYAIFEGYANALKPKQIDESATLVVGLLVAAFLSGMWREKKKQNVNVKSKASVIDWISGFVKWAMEPVEGNSIDFRDIKKYAYEGVDQDFVVENISILEGIDVRRKLSSSGGAKILGKFIAAMVNKFKLSKSDVDKIITKAK